MLIVDNAFVDPAGGRNAQATVTISTGQSVGWQNNGDVSHTVTSTQVPTGATTFDSGNMVPNATFVRTFTVAGTYLYRCDNHPGEMLNSTVIVT